MKFERLLLTPIGNGKYELAADYKDIPKGFQTDGASIPRFAWRVIGHPFESEYIDVFVEHDYDYQTGRISRYEADEKMLKGLKDRGCGYLKRYTIYWAVRIFGGSYYRALSIIALCFIFAGCGGKAHHIDLAGCYANQSGSIAIGSIEIQSAPGEIESAMVSYEDSKAWFSDAKEHRIRILLTGTNSVSSSSAIVEEICNAFIKTAPALKNEIQK
jgi:hypothetical protein